MNNSRWSGFLSYKAKHTDIESELAGSFVPINYFAVKGGANRLIDLTSADDISLVSELEQARKLRNITIYLPPSKNFEWMHFNEIAFHNLPLNFALFTSGNIGKTVTHQFTLACRNAGISEQPKQKADGASGNNVLMVNLTINDSQLTHGFRNGSDFVEENW